MKKGLEKTLFWATVLSGLAAAYMMYRRGESLGTSLQRATRHPFGELAGEIKTAWKGSPRRG